MDARREHRAGADRLEPGQAALAVRALTAFVGAVRRRLGATFRVGAGRPGTAHRPAVTAAPDVFVDRSGGGTRLGVRAVARPGGVGSGGSARPAARGAAAGGVAALAALDWAAVHTVPGRLVDGRSLRGALLTESRAASLLERVLDLISVTALLCAVCGILLVALVRQRREAGLAALAVLAGANVTTQVLKQWLLVRPDLGLDERTPATLNSLPSGHVTVALSVVVAVVLVAPARARSAAAAVGLGFTTAVTMAVMSSGWHRASDAVAACLVVGVWAALVLLVLALLPAGRRRAGPDEPARRRAGRAPPSCWAASGCSPCWRCCGADARGRSVLRRLRRRRLPQRGGRRGRPRCRPR